MIALRLARFAVRAEAREPAERAMHELATRVRATLPNTNLSIYRSEPLHYLAVIRSEEHTGEVAALTGAMAPFLDGRLEVTDCELVTSSDLHRRHRRR